MFLALLPGALGDSRLMGAVVVIGRAVVFESLDSGSGIMVKSLLAEHFKQFLWRAQIKSQS